MRLGIYSLAGRRNELGFVISSSTPKSYTFSHNTPVNGGRSHDENLYRLKMVDCAAGRKDGPFAYSRIQSVKFEGLVDVDLSVYPNPVSDKLTIRDFSQVTKVEIDLIMEYYPNAAVYNVVSFQKVLFAFSVFMGGIALVIAALAIFFPGHAKYFNPFYRDQLDFFNDFKTLSEWYRVLISVVLFSALFFAFVLTVSGKLD